ncbi:MAG: hypothetical protein A2284_04060, partial [Deltaproteobacteria bacterium RIFOXYA12_FULL_61_11]
MSTQLFSATLQGIEAVSVEVEVDISRGLPSFTTVGLAEGAVRESKDRVRAALRNSGYVFPRGRITVNLAPAAQPKDEPYLDLPIALGVLEASGQLDGTSLAKFVVLGELALSGQVKPVRGILPVVLDAAHGERRRVLLPVGNEVEAGVVEGVEVYPVATLLEAAAVIEADTPVPMQRREHWTLDAGPRGGPDFRDVFGQRGARRALEIAAAGGHNLLMIGPPGSGKSMMARRLGSILPTLSFPEALETTKIYSVAGLLEKGAALVSSRPFRAPHHTISDVALIGGGRIPKPGEVSLAHHGVLFLDEFPEFRKSVLEALRQPLESRNVVVSRAAGRVVFPCSFMLVVAMNPCPCGFLGDPVHECSCSEAQVDRYVSRISGPMLDRIDIQVEVPRLRFAELTDTRGCEDSAAIRARVDLAREVQRQRLSGSSMRCNAMLDEPSVRRFCGIDGASSKLLQRVVDVYGFSGRAVDRVLKVARTIADLEGVETV